MCASTFALRVFRTRDAGTQKCSLPLRFFNNSLKPGTWVKCTVQTISSKINYSLITQAFPFITGNDNCCYLDETVFFLRNEGELLVKETISTEAKILISIEPLVISQEDVKKSNITITLNSTFYQSKAEKLTLIHLKTIVQLLLQSFKLTQHCVVRSSDLLEFGIEQIVFAADASGVTCEQTTVLSIADEADITITNTRFNALMNSPPTFNLYKTTNFQNVYQELEEISHAAGWQRSKATSSQFQHSTNALIIGPIGCGKSTILNYFLESRYCNSFWISSNDVLGQYAGETEANLQRVFDLARLFVKQFKPEDPVVICVEDLHLICPAWNKTQESNIAMSNAMRVCTQLAMLLDQLKEEKSGIACLATTTMPNSIHENIRLPGRFDREIVITIPNPQDRVYMLRTLWQQSCLTNKLEMTDEMINMLQKQTNGYVAADLSLLVRTIEQSLLRRNEWTQRDLFYIIKESLQKIRAVSVRGKDISITRTMHGFEVIGGMIELKKRLEMSLLMALTRPDVFLRFGLTIPKGILLYGPSGCAKTTIAKCLANMLDYNFIATSGADIYSPYVGCAEKIIANIFDSARKNSPCLIFFDEIDTLVGRRSASVSDVQVRILSTLLTEMDGIQTPILSNSGLHHHILVIAATNRPDIIDEALLRPGRFDKLIHVPAPDLASRSSILQLRQKSMPFALDVDLEGIALRTVHYTGADLCNLCNEAALLAFQRNSNASVITALDFEIVLEHYKSSLTAQQLKFYYDFEKTIAK